MRTPGEKIDICDRILNGFEWKFLVEELEKMIEFKNTEISDALRSDRMNDALRLSGEKEALEKMKLLPKNIKWKNLGLISKVKQTLSDVYHRENTNTEAN